MTIGRRGQTDLLGLSERFSGSRESCANWGPQSMAGAPGKASEKRYLVQEETHGNGGENQPREPAERMRDDD
jgi:hypothetical protein